MIIDEPSYPDDPGGGGGGYPSGPIGTGVFDLYFNKHEASSILKVQAFCNVSSNDDLQFDAYLYVDGSLAGYSSVNMILDNRNSAARFPVTIPMFARNLPAGNRHIQLTFRNLEPDSPLTVRAGAMIEISEMKRAAQ